ncbi:MAG: glycosyltransferase [Methanobrevibacter sp.]|uniref:glycosyltransferase n=1 Tax=Methanobrevibacter sp. TaxID=66852 RepID=UPI0025EAD1DF|nr:glycosyltransferase [Methanobrevibacter sp.]MBR0270983.1 glycosyltransferase [Methanobrevibacter sp.]
MSWLFVILAFLLASIKTTKPKYQKVSVIIPAYNEENTVAKVVEVVKAVSFVDEIIVVDDGSSDNTTQEAIKAGAIVINHEVNKGKGEALYTGYKNAECDIIAFIDADIHNLTSKKVEEMIMPILLGKAEITKTKFARESGRVTELTAKPLLNFFFPEISFEQPLSGQFAARKEVLKKINFEKDYGVDVGIVIDADILGISIMEVDIGAIEHDMSPLADLNNMANEVVRTIMSRANKYGRVTMIDDIGYFIRMSIVGLSLVILGLFTIFFVKFIPLSVGVIITIIGIIASVYYIAKVIIQSIIMYRKTPRANLFKSFIRVHFPLIISMILLLLMLSTFLGAATFENGSISIEPNSRNLIIFTDQSSDNTVSVRGPYTVDSAIENESNVMRVPADAMMTLGIRANDTIIVNNEAYIVNDSRSFEPGILRLPLDVKDTFNVDDGDIIQDSRLADIFEKSTVYHHYGSDNTSIVEKYDIGSRQSGSWTYEIIVDNVSAGYSSGLFSEGQSYAIFCENSYLGSITYSDGIIENQNFTFNGHQIELKFSNTNSSSIKYFDNDYFIDLYFDN